MSQPKKKTSPRRRGLRRYASNKQMSLAQITSCPNCNEPTRNHRICKCGFYKGKSVIQVSVPEIAEA